MSVNTLWRSGLSGAPECKVVTLGLNSGVILLRLQGPRIVSFFSFFFYIGVSHSAHPRATNYNSHVTHCAHNKSWETELEYSKGLQGVSSQEKEGTWVSFCNGGGGAGVRNGETLPVHVARWAAWRRWKGVRKTSSRRLDTLFFAWLAHWGGDFQGRWRAIE